VDDYIKRLNEKKTNYVKIIKENKPQMNIMNKIQTVIKAARVNKTPIKSQETANFNNKSFSKKSNINKSEQHSDRSEGNDSLKAIEYLTTEPNKELQISKALDMSYSYSNSSHKKPSFQINNINNISIISAEKPKRKISEVVDTTPKHQKLISFLDKVEENNITIYTIDKHDGNILIIAINKRTGKSIEKNIHFTDIYPDGDMDKIKEYIEQNTMKIKGY
jgi:hypothetical protein